MKLEIKSFADSGDLEKERLVLRATADGDIGSFIVLRSQSADDGVSPISGTKNAYWLPDRTVKSGDLIVVYTKAGKSSRKQLKTGATAHFFYWGLKLDIWGSSRKNVAVILDARDWTSAAPPSKNVEAQ
ncbi:hypothetical protein [Caballeronia zhejiangensis]|jgi:hypothetical protein|uniref:hypothetical protein n=1 Tax=Caballeronia zhejiangensis TaxID=871203 RepID=UPI001FD3744D|nr:hypothetical protein [Caballeronia zhejiangensis]